MNCESIPARNLSVLLTLTICALASFRQSSGNLSPKFEWSDAPRKTIDIAISPDGKLLASASEELIRIRELPSGKASKQLEAHSRAVESLAFSYDGTKLASGGTDGTIRQWQMPSGELIATLQIPRAQGDRASARSLKYSPDGSSVVAVLGRHRAEGGPIPSEILVWEGVGQRSRAMGQNNGHNGYGQIAFPAHSNVFGAANGAGVSLFNLETGRESDMLAVPEVGMAWPLAMSPDSTLVASVSGKTGSGINPPGSLIVWNLKSKNAPEIIGALESEVRKLAFSHDGKLLIGCDKGGSIRLWDLATKKLVGQHHAHEGWANGIAFSPDDKLVVSGGDDGFVRVWSVAELMNERPN